MTQTEKLYRNFMIYFSNKIRITVLTGEAADQHKIEHWNPAMPIFESLLQAVDWPNDEET